MELKIEDLKIGDELECIDREFFNSKNTQHKKIEKFVISAIVGGGIHINGWNWIIFKDELKYFKKKEQSQYTFDDLIELSKKAVRDGAIFNFIFAQDFSGNDLLTFRHVDGRKESYIKIDNLKEGFDIIQSLYKETFVIESEEDIKRIKDNAIVTLSNGHELPAIKARRDEYIEFYGVGDFYFLVLKGATVTQSK